MDLSDFDNYWVELEKEKQLGISPETVKKIIERLLLESHLKLASMQETENKDIIATSTDRLNKEAKTLIRIEKEPEGAGKEDVEDFYSNLAGMNVLNAIYIINSYFTKDAREYATGLPIRLVDRKELSDLIYEVEALKFEKAFVSEINDTKATKYFRSKIKQRLTNIFLGLKDKIEEIDRGTFQSPTSQSKKPRARPMQGDTLTLTSAQETFSMWTKANSRKQTH